MIRAPATCTVPAATLISSAIISHLTNFASAAGLSVEVFELFVPLDKSNTISIRKKLII